MSRNTNHKRILEIMGAYLRGTATQEECVFLHGFYECIADDSAGEDKISEDEWAKITRRIKKAVEIKITEHDRKEETKKLFQKYKWPIAYAAAFLIIGCVGLGFLLKKPSQTIDFAFPFKKATLLTKAAIMTLGNGIHITADNKDHKDIPKLDGVKAYLPKADQLVYSGKSVAASMKSNTIHVSDKVQLQITLPDGTVVSLNSGSVLKFPEEFTANERKVELSGEAYFEDKSSENTPLKVVTAQQEVTALACNFNIKGYIDERDTRTTAIKEGLK